MPMMRRGPLDRYPPEWVLRQANAHQVEGSIEFHTDRPMTFYLDSGRIYAAELGTGLANPERLDASAPDEGAARQQVVSLLREALRNGDGWYFHDPLGHHPGRGPWAWETATLLLDARTSAREAVAAASMVSAPAPAPPTWTHRTVALRDTAAAPITLGPDAWAVVVQLAETASASDLRTRLGWNPDRLLQALTELEQRGGLGPEPNWRPKQAGAPLPPPPVAAPVTRLPPPPTARARPESHPAAQQTGRPAPATWPLGEPSGTRPPVASMAGAAGTATADHHTGPLAPPPSLADRAARRRLRPGRSASGS